ncbi:MAG: hypothetical protein QOH35_5626, partial [Acidobacteriaceae bacterium]|nr:hypothetical protein [Acidobacteriaceae bacterium]
MEKARPRRPNNRPVPRQRSSPLQLPSPLSSRVIMGQRPTYEDENGFYSATSLPGSAALPFVISTGAERS